MQNHLPDSRDNRGKRHDLAFVLTGLLWALLRSGGQLSLSKLHRWLVREHDWLVKQTGQASRKPISDPQLRRVLAGLDYTCYNTLNAQFFNWSQTQTGVWYSVDGKELRGSIDSVGGQKRGQAIVQLVCHEDSQAQLMGYYEGDKESERKVVAAYFKALPVSALAGRRFTLDALHLTPELLTWLHGGGSGYLVGAKANQAQLLGQLTAWSNQAAITQSMEWTKAHGRLEKRSYRLYPLPSWLLEERWQGAGLCTLIVVERHTTRLKDGQIRQEQAYFVSNLPHTDTGLCRAIREHWVIEADHHVRDTTAGEDGLRCGHGARLRTVSSLLTVGINLLRAEDRRGNLRAYWEDCTASRERAMACWKPS
ncbi:ISAs1 family transposase [Rudanella lutea]|uniref:ISAs1 family transposase n=1 Tax=Rudanella lutea TaxID=451374 RepID=UPI00146B0A8A|nr:ISAs1 family transposase [Rudanella lutea]